jgi:hypothetical protein
MNEMNYINKSTHHTTPHHMMMMITIQKSKAKNTNRKLKIIK